MIPEHRILECLPLAERVAWRYRSPTVDHEDLVQSACLGLVKAAKRFKPGGVPFRTYAQIMMEYEVKHYLRDCAWSVKIPRRIKERVLRRASGDLEAQRAYAAAKVQSLPVRFDNRIGAEDSAIEEFEYAPAVARVLGVLPMRERMILYLRFVEDLPQAEIARRCCLSQMHVSRLMRRSLARLREVVDKEDF